MAAKNKSNLSKFVGFTYIRKAGAHGSWFELASARATVATIDTTAQNVDVVSDTRNSVFKGVIPEAMIALTFLENADTKALSRLFGLTETAQASGSKSITAEKFTFGSDDKIVLPYTSNDGNGVNITAVDSYTLDTDYSVSVDGEVTTITRLGGGSIPANSEVAVTGSVNVNASESVELESKFTVKEEFEVKIEAIVEKDGVEYRRIVTLNPATLESTYAIDFLDVIKAGDITGASVEFKLSEGGKFKYYDEIITEEVSG